MPKPFISRLIEYYSKVAEVLRGEAAAASIFPNSTDIGTSRENVYVEFLKQHLPSKCNVFLGGFLFSDDGDESKQLDVIVTTDTAPRFDFLNRNGEGKSFSNVEGTLGVVSVKSFLDKKQLEDALWGIASIPPMQPLENRVPPNLFIKNYSDWPFKVVYASSGLTWSTLFGHIELFYRDNPSIPIHRRPNLIHVSGQYFALRAEEGMNNYNPETGIRNQLIEGEYYSFELNPDIQAILRTLENIQKHALASTLVLYNFTKIVENTTQYLATSSITEK